MTNEEIISRVAQKAGDYEELFASCAQGTLYALQEEFNVKDSMALKAATVFPGIALTGETCGAVVGSLMTLGILFGREKPGDVEAFIKTLQAARKFLSAFEKEFGSSKCKDIHPKLLGRTYNFADPKDAEEFAKAGGLKICRTPPEKAARIVAKIILDSKR